jgi:hypothetical protein
MEENNIMENNVNVMEKIQDVLKTFLRENWNDLTYQDEDQVAQTIKLKPLDDGGHLLEASGEESDVDENLDMLDADEDFIAGLWEHFEDDLDNIVVDIANRPEPTEYVRGLMGIQEGAPDTLHADLKKLVFDGLRKLDLLQKVEASVPDNA